MPTDVTDHPCELNTYGKLFFTFVVQTTHDRLDHEEPLEFSLNGTGIH